MRLSENEVYEIKRIFFEELKTPYQLRLFGSRIDDQKKGGDIDLILVVDPAHLEESRKMKYHILHRLYDSIGEQKIDILVTTLDKISTDEFLKSLDTYVNL